MATREMAGGGRLVLVCGSVVRLCIVKWMHSIE
jgi:hypothetical protein